MIAERIKKLREQHKITQPELAKKLGVSRTSVSAWEQGTTCPNVACLVEMTRLFHTSADYILGLSMETVISLDALSERERVVIYSILQYFNEVHSSETDKTDYI